MKTLLFLGTSTLFHAVTFGTLMVGNYLSLVPQASVQKGLGSIEVQIVILGQEGKSDRGETKMVKKECKEVSKIQDHLKEFLKPREVNFKESVSPKPEIQTKEQYLWKELESEIQTLILVQRDCKNPKDSELHRDYIILKPEGKIPESLTEQNQKNKESSTEKRCVMPLIVPAPKNAGAFQKDSFNVFGNQPPRYPKMAILRGWEGETIVRICVNSSGKVKNFEMIQSSGFSTLDEAVLKVLPQWHFERGKAREVDIPFKFALRTEK